MAANGVIDLIGQAIWYGKTGKFSMCSRRLWLICGCKNGFLLILFYFCSFFFFFSFLFVFGRTCARTTRWIKYHYGQQQQPMNYKDRNV